MTATKEQLVGEVAEQFETFFGLQLKTLSKMSKEDLETLHTRFSRMSEKPEELLSVLARRKIRARTDDIKERLKSRAAESLDRLLG